MKSNSFELHIKNFLIYNEIEKNRSLATLQNYDLYLNRFKKWCLDNKINDLSKIDNKIITNYRLWLNRFTTKYGENLSKRTQNYHLIALRSFFKYLSKNDVKTIAPEKIELAKTDEREIAFLEGNELERLLDAPTKLKQAEILKLRDRSILEVLFSTGLRVSEISNLLKEQVNLGKDSFTVKGKGGNIELYFYLTRLNIGYICI